MAYPPLGWGGLVVPGLVGLMVALRGQQGTRARTIGFLHGMTAFGLSLSWLFEIFGGMVVVLWCVLAALTALFAEMQSRAWLRGVRGWQFAVFTTLNWCGWEFIRAELFPLKFPWMTAGLAMGPNMLLPWIGVYGVSVLVLLAVGLIAAHMRKPAVVVLLLLILLGIDGRSSRSPEPRVADPQAVKVAGLQFEGVSLNEYLAGTRRLPPGVDLVVWPEYSVPLDIRANKRDWKLIRDLCSERGITLTFGTHADSGSKGEWRNIALTLDSTGALGEHAKVHSVHFFDDGIPGTTALPVQTAQGEIGTPICFDCDYEGVVRGMTAAGAELLVAPTMDAEKWTARQHDQHAELFRIRACENGRWIFVVATSGVSQVIDPHGHVHARLAALEQGALSGMMRRESNLTFYTHLGWLAPWAVLGAATLAWLILLRPCKRGAQACGTSEGVAS